jgi:methylenetetrahydrofolate reductase (NADPH)
MQGRNIILFEIIPQKEGIQELYDNIDPLMEFKPPFIDVTTSRNLFM